MASSKKEREHPDYFADARSPDEIRRQFITDPAQASIQPGLALGMELMSLMRVLPEAFRQSQEREMARLKRQGKDAAPRIDAMARSLEQAQALGELAQRGQARAERMLDASLRPGRCFHGFVSDADGKPLPDLVVRLGLVGRERGKFLEAGTCDDGYFRIDLPEAGDKGQHHVRGGGLEASLAAALDALESGARAGTKAADGSTGKSIPGQVEIYSRDQKLLHADPAPVELAEGSAYREYLLGARGKTPPPTGPREPVPPPVKGPPPPVSTKPPAKKPSAAKSPARKKPK